MSRRICTAGFVPPNLHRQTYTVKLVSQNLHRQTYTVKLILSNLYCQTCTAKLAPSNLYCQTCTAKLAPSNLYCQTCTAKLALPNLYCQTCIIKLIPKNLCCQTCTVEKISALPVSEPPPQRAQRTGNNWPAAHLRTISAELSVSSFPLNAVSITSIPIIEGTRKFSAPKASLQRKAEASPTSAGICPLSFSH